MTSEAMLESEVLHYLVDDKLVNYPLPWTIETDWTTEVVTVAVPRRIVMKFPNAALAEAFMKMAEQIDRENKAFEKEFERELEKRT